MLCVANLLCCHLLSALKLTVPLAPAVAPLPFMCGAGTHLPEYTDQVGASMWLMQEAGLNSFRDDLHWHKLERSPGRFTYPDYYESAVTLAEKSGMAPLYILGRMSNVHAWQDGKTAKPVTEEKRAAFARYAAAAASHYQGRVSLYELWNEWDMEPEPKGVGPYLELLRDVAPAIKAANPNALLLAGSTGREGIERIWIPSLIDAGANDHVDGYAIHPYVHCEGGRTATPEGWFDWLSVALQKLNRQAGMKIKPFYITEMSWPAHTEACRVSERRQAVNMAKLFMLTPFIPLVRGIWWYDLRNDGDDPKNMEHNFGMVRSNLAYKDAYRVARVLLPAIKGKQPSRMSKLGKVWSTTFRGGGQEVIAVWAEPSAQTTPLQVVVESGKAGARSMDWTAFAWNPVVPGRYAVSDTPVVISGSNLTVSIYQGKTLFRRIRGGL